MNDDSSEQALLRRKQQAAIAAVVLAVAALHPALAIAQIVVTALALRLLLGRIAVV